MWSVVYVVNVVVAVVVASLVLLVRLLASLDSILEAKILKLVVCECFADAGEQLFFQHVHVWHIAI